MFRYLFKQFRFFLLILVVIVLFFGFFVIPKIISLLYVPLEFIPKRTYFREESIETEIFFNNAPSSKECLRTLIKAVGSSSSTIDIAMYSFNSPDLAEALKKASTRGVEITLVINHDHVKKARSFFKADSPHVRVLPEKDSKFVKHTGSMHHKFFLIDRKENPLLITSSLNATDIQNAHDIGYVLTTRDSAITDEFGLEFDRIKNGIWGLAKIDDWDYSPFAKRINSKSDFFEIWWSPGLELNSIKGKLLETINQAEEELLVICWQITDTDILNALLKKSTEGVKVHVVTDKHLFLTDENLDFMQSPLIQVDINEDSTDGELKSFIHEHVLIVDGKSVLFGTNNWSGRGALSNDETIFYTNNTYLVTEFLNHFERLSEMLRNK